MKIYSKFRQYYDSALKVMGDTEDGIVYERKTEEFHLAENSNTTKIDKGWTNHFYTYKAVHVLGFCGKLYFFANVGSGWKIIPDEMDELYVEIEEIRAKRRYNDFGTSEIDGICGVVNKDRFSYTMYHPFDFNTFFFKYNTPIFLVTVGDHHNERKHIFEKKWKVTVNPDLSDYPLHRIFDPYTACQELAMYLGNELANTKTRPMPVGSDKIIAQSKGFDEWSFRKMPEGRK